MTIPQGARRATSVEIVTVARQFGSGGSELARAIGARMWWPVLEEDEVVRRVASRLGAPEADVAATDEHVETLAERMGASLAGAFPEVVLPPDRPTVDVERVAAAAFDVLRQAAAAPPIVMVGHGGMCLFAGRVDALHLRVVARREHRVASVARRLGISDEAADEEVRSRDADRAAWVSLHFDVEWDDPTLYSLTVNSERIGPDAGAALVETLLRR